MSGLDNGGFDLVVTLTEPTISTAARSSLGPATIPPRAVNTGQLVGTVRPAAQVTGAALPGGTDVVITIDLTGSILHVTEASLGGGARVAVPAWMADIPISATVDVTGRFTQGGSGGTSVFADFTVSGSYPTVTTTLDESETLAAPLIQLYLASVILSNPGDSNPYLAARAAVVAMLETAVSDAVRGAAGTIRSLIAGPPAGLPITSLTLLETPRFALTLCYRMGGPGGSTSSIGRLNVLTNTASGLPVDVAVLTLSNGGIFRDLLRPAISGALGLNPSGFLPGPQFAWFGSRALPIPGGLPPGVAGISLTSLVLGIDEAGRLRVSGSVLGTGTAGTFTVTATVGQAFSLGASPSPTGFNLTIAPSGPPTVTSDVQIPAWVYAASFLTGGVLLASVLLAIDLFAGPLISGPIGGAVTTAIGSGLTVPVPRPAGLPPVSPRLITSFQADAAARSITIGPVVVPFPFRDHDLIVNLV